MGKHEVATYNLTEGDCKRLAKAILKEEILDVNIIHGRLYANAPSKGTFIQREQITDWLRNDYLNDWYFVKSIDYLVFGYSRDEEVEGVIKFTATWVHEDEVEVAVSQLTRGDEGWAVLIFYGDEFTLIKDKLTKAEANTWQMTFDAAGLTHYKITELIRDYQFREFKYE